MDLPALLPARVKVRFARSDGHVIESGVYPITVTLVDLALPEFAGIDGFDGMAIVNSAVTYDGTNAAELQALAEQLATDWYRWRTGDVDAKYSAVVDWPLEAHSDHVEWTYRLDEVSTRVQRPVWNEVLEDLGPTCCELPDLPACHLSDCLLWKPVCHATDCLVDFKTCHTTDCLLLGRVCTTTDCFLDWKHCTTTDCYLDLKRCTTTDCFLDWKRCHTTDCTLIVPGLTTCHTTDCYLKPNNLCARLENELDCECVDGSETVLEWHEDLGRFVGELGVPLCGGSNIGLHVYYYGGEWLLEMGGCVNPGILAMPATDVDEDPFTLHWHISSGVECCSGSFDLYVTLCDEGSS